MGKHTIKHDEVALQAVREGRLLMSRYDSWLFEEIQPYVGQRVLDVGCGLGNLLVHLLDREHVVGLEVTHETVQEARQRFQRNPNVHIRQVGIDEPEALALRQHRFDTAISFNVLEHIESDQQAIAHIAEILEPGGHLVLIVPAHEWLYGEMDSSIGHYRRYTRETLGERVEQAGLRVLHSQYINALGALGWWFNGRVLHKTVPPAAELKLFNNLVPALRWVEKRIPPPFGISVLLVAQKPVAG